MAHEAMAFEIGAADYDPYNWRENPVKARVYIAAAKRHIDDFLDGVDFASDSGVHNLGHARACLAIILDAIEQGNLLDDRPPKGKSAEVLERLRAQKADPNSVVAKDLVRRRARNAARKAAAKGEK
jgi:hypothetical protein